MVDSLMMVSQDGHRFIMLPPASFDASRMQIEASVTE